MNFFERFRFEVRLGYRVFIEELELECFWPAFYGGIMVAVMTCLMAVSFSALIFSGELAGWIPYGISLILLSAVLISGLCAFSSSYTGLVAIPQDRVVPILAFMAVAVVERLQGVATVEAKAQTVLAVISAATVLGGFYYYLLGRFKLGNLIRFIPYPVIGGFLAGSGWLLFCGAFRVMTGKTFSLGGASYFIQSGMWNQWLPGVVFGFILFMALRWFKHFLCLPLVLLGGIGLFYGVLWYSGVTLDGARESAWLLESLPSVHFAELKGIRSLPLADWSAVISQYGSLAAVLLTGTVSILLNTTALELMTHRDMDLNRELRTVGVANMITGVNGGMMGFVSISLSRLPLKMGARGRVVGLVVAATCAAVLAGGTGFLGYVPKFVLGGVLVYLGLGFLVEWVVEGSRKLPRMDYAVVLLIFAVVGTFGYLQGVAVGVVAAAFLFIVGYSRVSVIASTCTGADLRSNVDRSIPHTRVLGEKGARIHILKLQGFVFFGSANSLLEAVRNRVLDPIQPKLRFVLLDFQRVTGLDSSAVLCLVKMKNLAEKEKLTLVFTLLSPEIQSLLQRGGLDLENDAELRVFRDRDHGIEWCEDQILEEEKWDSSPLIAGAEMKSTEKFAETLPQEEFKAYLDRLELPAGEILVRQGDPSGELYFLDSGRVSVYLELANGQQVRLRTLNEGTVVGELGLYLGSRRSASIRTDRPCVLYRLSLEAMKRMEATDLFLALEFHRYMTRLLAERLTNTNRALQAVLE